MQESLRNGFMAAFAVSGGVVFLAMHAHNRLLSDFIKKMEFDLKTSSGDFEGSPKKKKKKKKVMKKVRFADEVMAESSVEKAYENNHRRSSGEILEAMPQNWQALYKGILHRRSLGGYN